MTVVFKEYVGCLLLPTSILVITFWEAVDVTINLLEIASSFHPCHIPGGPLPGALLE